MSTSFTYNLDFHERSLMLRAQRQQVLASNIANADTPGFQARDFDFAAALGRATGAVATARMTVAAESGGGLPAAALRTVSMAPAASATSSRHLPFTVRTGGDDVRLAYRLPEQPSLDGNTVDLDRERASFADNSVRYEATLRFIDGGVRTMLSAIRGD